MLNQAAPVKADYPYVHEDPDRHGNIRVYFRRCKGAKKIRMRDPVGSVAFASHYAALVSESEAIAPAPVYLDRKPILGTFRWLCVEYFGSTEFKGLEPSTQSLRKRLLNHCFDETTTPESTFKIGDMPLASFNSSAVRLLRDRKAGIGLPGAANDRLKAISPVFKWALEEEIEGVSGNPAQGVKRAKGKPGGFHTWTVEEIEQYEARHPVGTKARLAMVLILVLAHRRADATFLGRQHVKNGWIKFTQHKNRNRAPVEIEIPMIPALQRVIDATPCGDLTFLVNEYGHAFSINGFGNKMRQWCDEAGLPNCSAHGLRKARAAGLASLGAAPHEIMAVTGHKTLAEVERYTKAYDRRRLAQSAQDRTGAASEK